MQTATTFETWMAKVDRILSHKLCGLNSMDLPDCCYGDWHEEGLTPAQAAKRAMRMANGDDCE